MNHIYHSIWNEALGTWIAVSDIAKGQGKRSSNRHRKILAISLLICTTPSWALPLGNQLVAGQATVSVTPTATTGVIPTANAMQINQTSQKAIINWQDFSVQQNETVNIQQPNVNAALLSRVVGRNASQIQGQINANGQVYLVNPNGILFGKTAQVDVGGLIATTHDIKDADFMNNGQQQFAQRGAKGSVENQGTIRTTDGGVVALISDSVINTGTISTPKGTTVLAAGKTVDLDFKGDGLVEVSITKSALNAEIINSGVIQADGGKVVLTAKAAGKLIDTVINQEGIIRAQGLAQRNGEIILDGDTVTQKGTLDVSGNTGGKVNINASSLNDSGTINADGTAGSGGKINMIASDTITQTASANTHANGTTTGGIVNFTADNNLSISGNISATGEQGGVINALAGDNITLAAAKMDASGSKTGGVIRVGEKNSHSGKEEKDDNEKAKEKEKEEKEKKDDKASTAQTTFIDSATTLTANGGAGKVLVWSDGKTDYYGSISANNVGNIEVSSKGILTYAGSADAGVGGHLLIDPENIIILQFASTPRSAFANSSAVDALKLANTLALGTHVTLQADNSISMKDGINVSGSNGGALTLFGKRINLNSINTANGTLTAVAKGKGLSIIKLDPGTNINAGAGKVILAADVFRNDSGLTKPITASQWLVYSIDPRLNTLSGMTADSIRYDQPYTGKTPSYASTGNWFLYSTSLANRNLPLNFANIASLMGDDISDIADVYETAIFNFNGVNGVEDIAYLEGLANPVNVGSFSSQTAPLQSSTTFLSAQQNNLKPDNESFDLIEIENDGIKLAKNWQMHIEFPVNACMSTANKS